MSSFSCPHYDMDHEACMRVRSDCVPGRPGCVLRHNSVFAVPAEERMRTGDDAAPAAEPRGGDAMDQADE